MQKIHALDPVTRLRIVTRILKLSQDMNLSFNSQINVDIMQVAQIVSTIGAREREGLLHGWFYFDDGTEKTKLKTLSLFRHLACIYRDPVPVDDLDIQLIKDILAFV